MSGKRETTVESNQESGPWNVMFTGKSGRVGLKAEEGTAAQSPGDLQVTCRGSFIHCVGAVEGKRVGGLDVEVENLCFVELNGVTWLRLPRLQLHVQLTCTGGLRV